MYRATLKEGKTYHVGGVTFTKGTPRVVSDELGEYLKTVTVFEVEELAYHEEVLESLHAADIIQAAGAEEKQGAAPAGPMPTGALGAAQDRKPKRTAKRGK